MLRIFTSVKIQRLRPGLNPPTWVPEKSAANFAISVRLSVCPHETTDFHDIRYSRIFQYLLGKFKFHQNLTRLAGTSRPYPVLQPGRSRVRFPDGIIWIFHWHNSSRPHYGPGVDSTCNRNEYQEYVVEGKGGRCVGPTTLPPSCGDCLEVWEPQSPGTLRDCNKNVQGLIYRHVVHLLYPAQFFLEWEMFQAKVVQKIKTHILCSTNCSGCLIRGCSSFLSLRLIPQARDIYLPLKGRLPSSLTTKRFSKLKDTC